MKTKFKILILFLLLISAIFINNEVKAMLPLSGKIIIVDAGHGGADPGTISNDIYESNINLAISKFLELELTKVGATVILTRDGNYDLSSPNARWRKKSDFDNRIKLINNSGANMYLSIHLNYLTDSKYSGAQVFYNNEENKEIAMVIQETLNNKLQNNRDIKKIPQKTYMYDKLTVPGVLIECGFLSNPKEKNLLNSSSYQQKIATTIKDALINYY
ncbi:MAG: N-acetylmuramoyl-L-alanine amidase [Bacilli bacterium]|jgi:N-acetylmuramoyl-L-alanine amidase|nr:N-acetylmuramoyl-L-alanine amidase [Bacilli bacterium]